MDGLGDDYMLTTTRIVLAMIWLGLLDLGDWDYWGDAWLGTRQQD